MSTERSEQIVGRIRGAIDFFRAKGIRAERPRSTEVSGHASLNAEAAGWPFQESHMNIKKTTVLGLALAALVAGSASSAHADESNKLTYVTFSQDVAIPGNVLPAGTYTFRLADTQSDRHIVQIFKQDSTQIIATLLTVADHRATPTDDTLIVFGEAAANAPPPITHWFYPGELAGEEFIYGKSASATP
jgi:hypothetical protein